MLSLTACLIQNVVIEDENTNCPVSLQLPNCPIMGQRRGARSRLHTRKQAISLAHADVGRLSAFDW